MSTVTSQPGPGTETSDAQGGARQLTTLRGWREFVADRPVVPDLLPGDVWRDLDDDGRFRYDETRLAHPETAGGRYVHHPAGDH